MEIQYQGLAVLLHHLAIKLYPTSEYDMKQIRKSVPLLARYVLYQRKREYDLDTVVFIRVLVLCQTH